MARERVMAEVAPWTVVRRKTELVLRLERRQGPLKTVLGSLVARGIKVMAHCSFSDWNGTTLLLVVENDLLARQILEAAGFKYRTESVVLVEASRETGGAARLGHSLADAGIDVVYSYVAMAGDEKLAAVFKTVNDDAAVRVLQDHSDKVNRTTFGPASVTAPGSTVALPKPEF